IILQYFFRYGLLTSIVLYVWKCLPLLALHQCVFHLIGLTFFNSFKETVPKKCSSTYEPFICFRVVTRGLYPRLVKDNLTLNIEACKRAGMTNFLFEIVTDSSICLPANHAAREIVVPEVYRPKSGALFKARALSYCLEDEVNKLKDSDWVVHLDEETLLTQNSVCGILNFVCDGRHDFGQGMITYASGEIVNWWTTLSDMYRVADDCGKLRAQLSLLHKPIFGWKGSYVVTRYGAERTIGWDHGPEGSICEDAFFGIVAMQAGYSFDFIEGEMLEKSPFTVMDMLKQRKRWLEGLLLTVHSKKIRFLHKISLALVVYSWALAPLMIAQCFIAPFFPLPRNVFLDSLFAAMLALNLYMSAFGVIRSFTEKNRNSIQLRLIYCIGACFMILFTVVIQAASVLLFVFGPKKDFYIVKKETDWLI
ncbi:hypothetical protein PMAYCL1PPCAC_09667, partial [Pristionchus mayeri]